jgi:hypothetical protein
MYEALLACFRSEQMTAADLLTHMAIRVIQWGWNPVGLNDPLGLSGLVNMLEAQGAVGTVVVTTGV